MKILFTLVLVLTMTRLHCQDISEQNNPKKHPTLVNTTSVDVISGKPVDFYLQHKDISNTAKLFYKGEYALSDDDGTFSFLDSVLTDNYETRPFYFFILSQAVKISDGAVSEYVSGVCVKYIGKFPCEFLSNSKSKGNKIETEKWALFVADDFGETSKFDKYSEEINDEIVVLCPARRNDWKNLALLIKKKIEDK